MYYLKLSIGTLLIMVFWLLFVFITAFYGWWMNPIAPHGDSETFFSKATEILKAKNQGNAALVLIEAGEVTKEYYSSLNEQVNKDTVFLTASMSKWLTANGVMKLVQDGAINLDESVSTYLTRWELPPSEFDNDQVTIRQLLSHTAGLTDELGFGDYHADERLPSLEESLTNPRASSDRNVNIGVTTKPGVEWNYSGGGYLILQLLIEEVTEMTFQEYMREVFFKPLEMSRSTYRYMATIENNAGSYDRYGKEAAVYQYASSAATGFVTSSADLTKFVLSQTSNKNARSIVETNTLKSMRMPHGRTLGFDIWGLGTILYAPTRSGDSVFGHDGGNDPAINSTVRINPDSGDAIIVLETGHPSLATNIGSHWVLWQTGFPDILASDAVIDSVYFPALFGVIILLLASTYLGFIHYHQPHNTQ